MITSVWYGPGQPFDEAAAIIREVFLDELGADPAHVFDQQDAYSYHLVLRLNGESVAAGRLSYVRAGVGQIGCVAVRRRWRRQGLGDALVKVLLYRAWDLALRRIRVLAREDAMAFYQRLGFVKTGESMEEDGVRKYWMEKETDDGTRDHCTHQCACAQGQDGGLDAGGND